MYGTCPPWRPVLGEPRMTWRDPRRFGHQMLSHREHCFSVTAYWASVCVILVYFVILGLIIACLMRL